MKNTLDIFAAVLGGNITKLEHTDQVVAGLDPQAPKQSGMAMIGHIMNRDHQ